MGDFSVKSPVEPSPETRSMRIGEVAELTGTTPRTIRYYEEIGLLGGGLDREIGKHRCYSQADVERLREIVRLKELLGLSLEELSQLLEAESARAGVRRELRETDDPRRQRELVATARGHIEMQLGLVRRRIAELGVLERDLSEREDRCRARLALLEADGAGAAIGAGAADGVGAAAPIAAPAGEARDQPAGAHSGA